MLGNGVQLNSDGLDPAHGLVAVDAARVVSRGRQETLIEGNFQAGHTFEQLNLNARQSCSPNGQVLLVTALGSQVQD